MIKLEVVYLTRLQHHAETYHQVLKALNDAGIETFVAQLARDAGILVREYDRGQADIIVQAVFSKMVRSQD